MRNLITITIFAIFVISFASAQDQNTPEGLQEVFQTCINELKNPCDENDEVCQTSWNQVQSCVERQKGGCEFVNNPSAEKCFSQCGQGLIDNVEEPFNDMMNCFRLQNSQTFTIILKNSFFGIIFLYFVF